MNTDKIIQALKIYDDRLRFIQPVRHAEGLAGGTQERRAHIRWMCMEAIEFAKDGKIEKAFRWLGFIQGSFWMMGLYSIAELKSHNMPDVNVDTPGHIDH